MKRLLVGLISVLGSINSAFAAFPVPWQMDFQEPASPMMSWIVDMHNVLLILILGVALVVGALMVYVLIRYRASRNPVPSKTAHNTMLEIVWTLIPAIILLIIGIPSMKLLFKIDRIENAQMTLKATGHQWYWSYDYPEKNISFDSYMIEDKNLKPGQMRLLEVDNRVIVPMNTTVRVLITSVDVIHSFSVPSFGIKKDAVPGRLNETWFRIAKEGTYYGQCSELCGIKHGFMPIAIEVVSQEKYDAWVKEKAAPATPASKAPAENQRGN